jgi:hypothetical protein
MQNRTGLERLIEYCKGITCNPKTGLSTAEQYHYDGIMEGIKLALNRSEKILAEEKAQSECPDTCLYTWAEVQDILKKEKAQEEKDKDMPFIEYFNGLPQEEKDRVLHDFKELEQSQKPTAPASLVKALEKYISKSGGPSCNQVLKNIISAYQAEKPTADKGFLEVVRAEADKYAKMPTTSFESDEYNRIKGISQGLYMAAELLSRYTPAEPEKWITDVAVGNGTAEFISWLEEQRVDAKLRKSCHIKIRHILDKACQMLCGEREPDRVGRYSRNCKYLNRKQYCSLPESTTCEMGFISKCSGIVKLSRHAGKEKGE